MNIEQSVIVFVLQLLFSFFYAGQTIALAKNKRLMSLFSLTGVTVLWLLGTFISLEALKAGDYITCGAYLLGNLVGNDITFMIRNKRKKNDQRRKIS